MARSPRRDASSFTEAPVAFATGGTGFRSSPSFRRGGGNDWGPFGDVVVELFEKPQPATPRHAAFGPPYNIGSCRMLDLKEEAGRRNSGARYRIARRPASRDLEGARSWRFERECRVSRRQGTPGHGQRAAGPASGASARAVHGRHVAYPARSRRPRLVRSRCSISPRTKRSPINC